MTETTSEAPASLWRKRPVTVPAIRWTGSNLAEVQAFAGGPQWFAPVAPEDREDDPERTAEVFDKLHSTWVGVHDGQWIIRGVKDELYPCDDEVLRETYEPAPRLPDDVPLRLGRCPEHPGKVHAQLGDGGEWACLRGLADVAEAGVPGDAR